MLKPIMFAVSLVCAVVYASHDAYSQLDCMNDTRCPCRDWDQVKANLEFTAGTPGPNHRGCAEVRVRGGQTAFSAFEDCNPALRGPGPFGGANRDRYNACAAYVCNWFVTRIPPWVPAC
jgi:hypothetical protein